MANQIEVINLGLSQVKGGFIESLTEGSREAGLASRIWDIARDAALTDISPRFARTQVALTELTETVTGFDYVYSYPGDCLDCIEIYNQAKVDESDRIPFEIGCNAAGNGKTILTMVEEAELIYTRKVTTVSVFDMLFVEALAWKLAMYFAIPLKGDEKLQNTCAHAYIAAVGLAKAKTKNEGHQAPDTSSSFVRAR